MSYYIDALLRPLVIPYRYGTIQFFEGREHIYTDSLLRSHIAHEVRGGMFSVALSPRTYFIIQEWA